jgi:hypothetical protein
LHTQNASKSPSHEFALCLRVRRPVDSLSGKSDERTASASFGTK